MEPKGQIRDILVFFGFIMYLSLYQSIMSLQDISLHFSAF